MRLSNARSVSVAFDLEAGYIAAAVGAFVVSAISLSVIDAGIVHGGAIQVLYRYL